MNEELKQCFPPAVTPACTKLILGSMPGEESLRRQQYYAHPRNVFWPLLADLLGFAPDLEYEKRLQKLLDAGIALWDTVARCTRPGSLDSNITMVTPNDFTLFLSKYSRINTIFFNGKSAYNFFIKYNPELVTDGPRLFALPSTSPACAMLNYATKRQHWAILTQR